MISSEVQRTLVKSPPELWSELSDPAALARHLGELGELGEIRITRVDPEQTVEWEAGNTTGTVLIKPSGWGTKVTLTANREIPEPEPPAVAEAPAIAEPPAEEAAPEPARRGFFSRMFGRRREEPSCQDAPVEVTVAPEPPQDVSTELQLAEETATEEVTAVLTSVLDRLGAAHHRPFSRA
ncbi:MAG TPA: hypothetical protein VES97_09730 [Solirubrobacteraceae bacterium]|nr:hypothetical protein [Solirubrobacteraceae bacterium]